MLGRDVFGAIPVMMTPFTEAGEVDYPALAMLTEWFIASGSAGLFPVSQSSEMYNLNPEERLATAQFVKNTAAGRVPVIASGTFGNSVEEMAEFMKEMAQIVDAVVVLPCQLAKQDESESVLRSNLERLLALTPGIQLGIYEVPVPYHRLLEAETLAWLASTQRFIFHKDTSRRNDLISAKISCLPQETTMGWYNGNCTTLLHSLEEGGQGFTGISMNFYPFLFPWIVKHFKQEPEKAQKLQRFLTVAEGIAKQNYPASAKAFLKYQWGVDVSTKCRTASVFPADVPEEHEKQAALMGMLNDICTELSIEVVKPGPIVRT